MKDITHGASIRSIGLGRILGLHPLAATITVLTDTLLFGGEVLSGGLLIVFSLLISVVLGWVVNRVQRDMFGDDEATALTKAVVIVMITAIPTPLSPFIAIPTGIVGVVGLITRRKS